MRAFILAGGFATRLWPLTEKRAKPLLPIAGKPLISSIVEGVPKDIPITVSTNATFEEDFLEWKQSVKRDIDIVIEDAGHEGQKLGALGAVAAWVQREEIDDDILLLAGDNYAEYSLPSFIQHFRGNPLIAGHDCGSLATARLFGTIVTEKKEDSNLDVVISFEEKPESPRSTIVSTGWWILPKTSLPILQAYAKEHPDNVGGIFEEFLRRSVPVDCLSFTELWKDIGSFDAYMDLHRTVVGNKTIAASSATVDTASDLKGSIDLGKSVRIAKSSLRDCIIFGHCTVEDCVLERCIIDEGCTLKGIDLEDKMLRSGTTLIRRS